MESIQYGSEVRDTYLLAAYRAETSTTVSCGITPGIGLTTPFVGAVIGSCVAG